MCSINVSIFQASNLSQPQVLLPVVRQSILAGILISLPSNSLSCAFIHWPFQTEYSVGHPATLTRRRLTPFFIFSFHTLAPQSSLSTQDVFVPPQTCWKPRLDASDGVFLLPHPIISLITIISTLRRAFKNRRGLPLLILAEGSSV